MAMQMCWERKTTRQQLLFNPVCIFGQWIERNSPQLRLSTPEIPLYDPENLAIPSCSQEDWDLAIRIVATGRMARLGTVCTSYQGEVNETNETRRKAIA